MVGSFATTAVPPDKNYNENGGIADEMGSLEKRLDCESVADEIIDNRFGNKVYLNILKRNPRVVLLYLI
jgi:hypothetical protein